MQQGCGNGHWQMVNLQASPHAIKYIRSVAGGLSGCLSSSLFILTWKVMEIKQTNRVVHWTLKVQGVAWESLAMSPGHQRRERNGAFDQHTSFPPFFYSSLLLSLSFTINTIKLVLFCRTPPCVSVMPPVHKTCYTTKKKMAQHSHTSMLVPHLKLHCQCSFRFSSPA